MTSHPLIESLEREITDLKLRLDKIEKALVHLSDGKWEPAGQVKNIELSPSASSTP